MRSLRTRLILSHILPVLIAVPLLGLLGYVILTTQGILAGVEGTLERQTQELAEQAEIFANASGTLDQLWRDPNLAQSYVTGVDLKLSTITLLDTEGRILASNAPLDAERVGELLDRADISAVLTGESNVEIQYDTPVQPTIADVLVPVFGIDERLNGVVLLSQEVESAQSNVQTAARLLLITLILLAVLGALLGLYLALRLERALQRVTTTLHRLASGATPSVLPEQGTAEIDALYRAVNDLVTRLRDLEEARRRLLANLVHELGRPLGSLKSAVHALRHGADQEPALRQELLAGMDAQIDRMAPLLDNLTRLHGQLLGPLELQREPTLLNQWLAEVMALWKAAAEQKGVQWRADIPLNLPSAEIDPDQMARALGNIFSNAVKYTPVGEAILVEAGVEADGDACWVRVTDSGPGIAASDLERIFAPFQRGSEQRFPQGMGLGLTIAQEIVAAHGGTIAAESTPGKGSRFTLAFPRDTARRG